MRSVNSDNQAAVIHNRPFHHPNHALTACILGILLATRSGSSCAAPPPPTVEAILPSSADNSVSPTVTILGTGFVTTSTAWLNNALLPNTTFIDSDTLTATMPD